MTYRKKSLLNTTIFPRKHESFKSLDFDPLKRANPKKISGDIFEPIGLIIIFQI